MIDVINCLLGSIPRGAVAEQLRARGTGEDGQRLSACFLRLGKRPAWNFSSSEVSNDLLDSGNHVLNIAIGHGREDSG